MPILLMGSAMALTQYVIVTSGLWNLGALGAGLAGMLMGLLLAAWNRRGSKWSLSDTDRMDGVRAMLPYVLLILFTLMLQFVSPLRQGMSALLIEAQIPRLETRLGFVTPAHAGTTIFPLRHAGAILLYTSFASYAAFRLSGHLSRGAYRDLVADTVRKVLPPSIGIAAMVSMAVVMANSGMTQALAEGLASLAGGVFPFMSVWIGALGAFITGSNTNSNVIFSLLQRSTAEMLTLPVGFILAAQTAGAALGSVLSPTKVVVGASTTGMRGQEGRVLRVLLGYVLILLTGLGLVVSVMVLL